MQKDLTMERFVGVGGSIQIYHYNTSVDINWYPVKNIYTLLLQYRSLVFQAVCHSSRDSAVNQKRNGVKVWKWGRGVIFETIKQWFVNGCKKQCKTLFKEQKKKSSALQRGRGLVDLERSGWERKYCWILWKVICLNKSNWRSPALYIRMRTKIINIRLISAIFSSYSSDGSWSVWHRPPLVLSCFYWTSCGGSSPPKCSQLWWSVHQTKRERCVIRETTV